MFDPQTKICELTATASAAIDLTVVATAFQTPALLSSEPFPAASTANKLQLTPEQYTAGLFHMASRVPHNAVDGFPALEFALGDLVTVQEAPPVQHQTARIRLSAELLAHHLDCAYVVKWKDSRWGVHFLKHHPVACTGPWGGIRDHSGNPVQQSQARTPQQIEERFKHLIAERAGIHASRIVSVQFPEAGRGVGIANYHVGSRHRIMWWDGYWFVFSFVV